MTVHDPFGKGDIEIEFTSCEGVKDNCFSLKIIEVDADDYGKWMTKDERDDVLAFIKWGCNHMVISNER